MNEQPDLRRIFAAAARMNAGQARQVITLAIQALEEPATPEPTEGEKHFARRKKFIDRMHESTNRVCDYAKHETLRNIEKHFRDNPPLQGAEQKSDPSRRSLAARLTFDRERMQDELIAALREDSKAALTAAGQAVFDELARDDPWTLPSKDAIAFLDTRANLLANVPGEIQDEISAAIQDGLERGETRRQLMERIRAKFDGISKGRAETIANTEAAAAFNYARDKAMRAAGVTHKKWLHSQSPDIQEPRPTHVEHDGQVRPIDKPFNIAGVKFMHPGDDSLGAGPEDIINCHCVAIPVEKPVKGKTLCEIFAEEKGHPFRGNQYTMGETSNETQPPRLGKLAERYTKHGTTEARVVEDLFDRTNPDREANIAHNFNLNTVTKSQADKAATEIQAFTQWHLKHKRKLSEFVTVYRAGGFGNSDVVGVTLKRSTAGTFSKLRNVPIDLYTVHRSRILADIEALRPLGFQEAELLVHPEDLRK